MRDAAPQEGLRFSCTRCSACCRYEPGYVFLSREDAETLASALEIAYDRFIVTYCRWIPAGGGIERLSLREKADYDCIFWREGCSVYESRPLQCRTFPFWPANLSSPEAWKSAAAFCPGMDKGALHGFMEIQQTLALEKGRSIITRPG
ncbi:MAG: YkgJ family cysteine cluster protein [Treponema sp.]|nr:YkgJ family cysteine cluster protein [Treponema sp.]